MHAIIEQFSICAAPQSCARYGNGHINETYLVVCQDGHQYILQKLSKAAFHDPDALMRNIRLVTGHLATKASDSREVLTLVPVSYTHLTLPTTTRV